VYVLFESKAVDDVDRLDRRSQRDRGIFGWVKYERKAHACQTTAIRNLHLVESRASDHMAVAERRGRKEM
jgi:hypothetical protein